MAGHTRGTALDEDSKAMLFEGLNMSEMQVAFGMDHKTLTERLHGIPPRGVRRGVPIYRLKDIIGALWKPNQEQIDEALQRLGHNELPKMLTKEYWAGKRSKQEFEIKNGDLWSTTEVVERVSELLKIVKMQALLMVDAVERNSELTEKHKTVIKQLTDGMLRDLHKATVEKFQEAKPVSETNDEAL